MRKKILSAVLALAMALTLLPGVALADNAQLTNGTVLPAVLRGGDGEDTLCAEDSYKVSAQQAEDGSAVRVAIQAKELRLHRNGENGPAAFWLGFAVTPPAGKAEAVKMKTAGPVLDAAALSLENVEAEALQANVDGNGAAGFARYINALNTDFYAGKALYYLLQWCDERGDAIEGLPAAIYAVTLDKENFSTADPTAGITAAALADTTEGGEHKDTLYEEGTYAASPFLSQDAGGFFVSVELDARKLEEHRNGQGTDGYWAGYHIPRPENAESVKYAAANTRDALALTGEAVELDDGDDGMNFYFDMAKLDESKTWAMVQWLDKDGKAISTTCYQAIRAKDMTLADRTAAEPKPELSFTDVADNAWYYDEVAYVCEKGIMKGTGDGRFSPHAATTRAMVITMLYRLEKEPAVEGTAPFVDVVYQSYYENAVIWAAGKGLVNGVSDKMFAPDASISRQELAVMLYRYAVKCGKDTGTAADDLKKFPDAGSVKSYAKEAMAWAVARDLLQGTGSGKLDPTGTADRAQLAAIMMRFCEKMDK